MSVFTIVIFIWAIYQIATSLTKKRGQTYPGRLADPLRQIQETWKRGPFPIRIPESISQAYRENYGDYGDNDSDYAPEEGNEGTGEFEEIPGQLAEGKLDLQEKARNVAEPGTTVEQISSEKYAGRDTGTSDEGSFPITERDVRQGIIWAEVLGQPRALKPFGRRG